MTAMTALVPAQPLPIPGGSGSAGWRGILEALDGYRPETSAEQRLREDWLTRIAAMPQVVHRSFPGAHVTASALPLSPDGGRVLLCKHPCYARWGPWGGHVASGDPSPAAALRRELSEEAGPLPWRISSMLTIAEHDARCLPAATVPHLDVMFAVSVPELEPDLHGEVSTGGWFPVTTLPDPQVPDLEAVLEVSIRAVTGRA